VTTGQEIEFLFDVDNTLFDNDRFNDDLDERLERDFVADGRKRYRSHQEALRDALGHADYLGAVQLLRDAQDFLAAASGLAAGQREQP